MVIRCSAGIFLLLLASASGQQTPLSPCPNVFSYEPPGSEAGRWYGVISLSTDSTLHSLWLNIVLDSKADILGNWVGDVTTSDNVDFKIENTKMKIHPGPATAVRFFVQYSPLAVAPKLQAIRLNGREICNANTPQPAVERPEETEPELVRPVDSRTRPQDSRPATRPDTRPNSRPATRPSESPVYSTTANPPIEQSNVNPFSIGGGQVSGQSIGTQTGFKPSTRPAYQATTAPQRQTTTTATYDSPDFDEVSEPNDSIYFTGGPVTIVTNGNKNKSPTAPTTLYRQEPRDQDVCGKVVRNVTPNPLVVNGKPTLEGQWPWQIALYQTQTVDNKYICGGTLVSRTHIITAAHCVTRIGSSRQVNPNTLMVYLGKHNLRTSVEGVQITLVGEIKVHPRYNASSFSNDLAILQLREPVKYTDFVRPACLWPESLLDLSNVIGKRGSVVGWGFDDKGLPTEELTLVEMPVVLQETCIRSYSEFFARFTSENTYCAGYRDGTSVCNGDSGGGMVFNTEGTWYLRGLVSLSVVRQNERLCDPSHYIVFTDLAKFLPWIKQIVNDN